MSSSRLQKKIWEQEHASGNFIKLIDFLKVKRLKGIGSI